MSAYITKVFRMPSKLPALAPAIRRSGFDGFLRSHDAFSCSNRHCDRYSNHAQQVAGRHGDLKLVIDTPQSAKHSLSNPTHGLAPTEVLLDAFAHDLTKLVTGMARRAAIDRTAAATGVIAGNVRGDFALAASIDKVARVVSLVRRNRAPPGWRQGIKHRQRSAPLAKTIRVSHYRTDDQAVAILHQHVPLI